MRLVRSGFLRLTVPGQSEEVLIAVSGGLLEVQPDSLTVLAEVAIRTEELDQQRAENSRKKAEERLQHADSDKSMAEAQAALAAAIAELKTLDFLRKQK